MKSLKFKIFGTEFDNVVVFANSKSQLITNVFIIPTLALSPLNDNLLVSSS